MKVSSQHSILPETGGFEGSAMAVELMFDPFVLMKEFNQTDAKFDPYKLPLMSSLWPSAGIVLIYLFVLRMSPR